jgi:hypothetical protein
MSRADGNLIVYLGNAGRCPRSDRAAGSHRIPGNS